MKSDNKNEILKEKLKQALTSTARAISDDFRNKDKPDKNEKSKFFDNFNLENLNSNDSTYLPLDEIHLLCNTSLTIFFSKLFKKGFDDGILNKLVFQHLSY